MRINKNLFRAGSKISAVVIMLAVSVVSCVPDTETSPTNIEGSWTCKEVHSSHGTQTYKVNIAFDAGSTTNFKIYNFLELGSSYYVKASIKSSSITIDKQMIGSHEVAGSGTVAAGSKSITLNHTDDPYGDGTTANVTATYTR